TVPDFEAWLACVRLRQRDRPGVEFLYPDDIHPYTSPLAHRFARIETGARTRVSSTLAARPGALGALTAPLMFLPTRNLAVGGGISVPYDVAVLPARTAAGAP